MGRDFLTKDFNFWRRLINFWTILFFSVIVYDFFTNNSCDGALNLLATVYISILAIYVSNKEFERWYDRHQGQHPGEVFVVIWSVLVFSLMIAGLIFKDKYHLPGAIVSSYIAVLTILAITRKSKDLYQRRRKPNSLKKKSIK